MGTTAACSKIQNMNYADDPGRYLAMRTEVRGQDECWPWLLSAGSHGYGQGWDGQTVRTAHSMTWEFWTGEKVSRPMTIDHICHNKLCQNPRHLRVIPNKMNATDNGFAGRTHCPQGHEYTDENTYRGFNKKRGRNYRQCRTCAKQRRQGR